MFTSPLLVGYNVFAGLTPAEARVAVRVAAGESNRAIALDLRMSPHTINHYVLRVQTILGERDRSAIECRVNALFGADGRRSVAAENQSVDARGLGINCDGRHHIAELKAAIFKYIEAARWVNQRDVGGGRSPHIMLLLLLKYEVAQIAEAVNASEMWVRTVWAEFRQLSPRIEPRELVWAVLHAHGDCIACRPWVNAAMPLSFVYGAVGQLTPIDRDLLTLMTFGVGNKAAEGLLGLPSGSFGDNLERIGGQLGLTTSNTFNEFCLAAALAS